MDEGLWTGHAPRQCVISIAFKLGNGTVPGGPFNANIHLIGFAEDLTIVVTGIDSKNEAKNILHDIEGNCQKLGFIISQRKTILMVIKSPPPSEIVKFHVKKINWVANHKILDVHHQKSLDAGKQI